MIHIKHIEKGITITPMPSSQGRFGDVTLPDCDPIHCCLVMASRTTAMQGVSVPKITEVELENAITKIIDETNIEVEVSDKEAQDKLDSIRGYTVKEMEEYIEDNKIFKMTKEDEIFLDNNGEKVLVKTPTEAEAHDKLVTKTNDMMTMQQVAVTVPTLEEVRTSLVEEKIQEVAKQKATELINAGFLVTNLDALDEDGNEIFAGWKSQFDVNIVADI
jgi:hypothetical protein